MIILPYPGDDIDNDNDKDSDKLPDGCPRALPWRARSASALANNDNDNDNDSDSDDIIITQMVVHVPCPGEPAPSLLSPLLRSLPGSEITTIPVFVVSAKLVFEVFTNAVPLWVCGTTLRQL